MTLTLTLVNAGGRDGTGPFQVLKRINNNAYKLDLPEEYGVHTTFNVMYLTLFVGSEDEEAEALNLRTNPLQERGDDGRGPSTSPTTRRSRPTTRAIANKIQEDWDAATDGRETFLYMFKQAKTLVE